MSSVDGLIYFGCNLPDGCGEIFYEEDNLSFENQNFLLTNKFSLYSVYPNPFNPSTDIGFTLDASTKVSLIVYDVNGRKIRNNETDSIFTFVHKWSSSHYFHKL